MQRSVFHIKRKHVVQVTNCKEKGKTGKVLKVLHASNRVLIEKLNLIKKHQKPTAKGPGGITEVEGSVHASNVLLYCEKCAKGVRTSRKVVDSGKKVRVCVKCEAQLDK